MTTISDITGALERTAPKAYQESYDNSGLLIGRPETAIEAVLVSLDITEEVIDEAIAKGAGLIVSHHPIIFGNLKRLNGANHVERCVIKAIENGIALYAIHTNLDNVSDGVNMRFAQQLGLEHLRILQPKTGLLNKLVTFVPGDQVDDVAHALFEAGAGQIGSYDQCSFRTEGTGTFRGGDGTDPFVGIPGDHHSEPEYRLEVLVPTDRVDRVLKALKEVHPYEEVAWDLIRIENPNQDVGSGMIGTLPEPVSTESFLNQVKKTMGGVVRHTRPIGKEVQTIAICGGSGSFLLPDAIRQGADVFVTADFKYHQFFDADNRIVIADIGHFESEQFTISLVIDVIHEKFPNFAAFRTGVNTNPISYL